MNPASENLRQLEADLEHAYDYIRQDAYTLTLRRDFVHANQHEKLAGALMNAAQAIRTARATTWPQWAVNVERRRF